MPVLGICNGFQVLCEAHLLPGALMRNERRKFVCTRPDGCASRTRRPTGPPRTSRARNSSSRSRTCDGSTSPTATLDAAEAEGRVVVRYLDGNPNGSLPRHRRHLQRERATSSA